MGQALHGNCGVLIIFLVATYDAHNLFEQIVQPDRAGSAVPQKGYGVPAHRDDND